MHAAQKEAHRHVLKKLIEMAQGMMMDGMGDSEEAGGKLKEAVKHDVAEGSPEEEAQESPAEAAAEGDDDGPMGLHDHIKSEMKKGNRYKSPMQSRKVAIMVAARPGGAPGRGKF